MQIYASLVNAAFKSSKKIEMPIFVATHKTTRFHCEALTAKNIKVYHSCMTSEFHWVFKGAVLPGKKFW